MKENPFKDFFYFRKSDRRAIVALGCIAVFCIGVLMVVDAWRAKERAAAVPRKGMAELALATGKTKITPPISDSQIRPFDPNTVDSLTLVSAGVKPWKVRNFLHYRAAGKVFRSAEDMGNTYGWTTEDVDRVAPYVRVGALPPEKRGARRAERGAWVERLDTARHISQKFHAVVKVDANATDSATLCRIPGIGPGISRAILRYRQRLGGFCAVEQLTEIAIFSPELLEWFFVSDSSSVSKINVNKASFQRLNTHPYITYEQTKALLQYLRLYGPLQNEQQLLSTAIFTPEELERLRPYIAYE